MPVARPRRRNDPVRYVIVRTDDGYDTDDDDYDDVLEDAKKSASVTSSITSVTSTRTVSSISPTATTPLFSLEATATSFANERPSDAPQIKPNRDGGISQTTEHLLIGAGSVGATIIIVLIIFALHTMRKHQITFTQAVKRSKYLVTSRGPPPPPPPKSGWDKSAMNEYHSNIGSRLDFGRSGSTSSQRPLIPTRSDSFNTRQTSPGGPSPPVDARERSFYLDPAPPGRKPSLKNNSEVSSPPALPLQSNAQEESALPYPVIPTTQTMSPRRPPPTFRQFLNNRPSISAQKGLGPMISRFSWTNSNAPQTPHDPSRDTNSHTVVPTRDSYMTQRSSVPRFRTIDSWVTQQANRLEEQKLAEQLRGTRSSTSTTTTTSATAVEDQQDGLTEVPEVPELPKNVLALQKTGDVVQPLSPLELPGKLVRHERHDTNTTNETAPIFRQHPGNEVRFSTRSLVPSEILNSKMRTSVL